MQEENRVAEIEEIEEEKSSTEPEITEEEIQKKKLRDLRFEMVLFFILGLLIGITIKTEAIKNVTIGFNDYQLKNGKQAYDIEKIKADIVQEAKNQAQAAQEQSADQPAINAPIN